MANTLRVLILEDEEHDALLALRELASEGFHVTHQRVFDPDGTRDSLAASQWDLILSDYVMPQFTALDALRIVEEMGLDIPFIILSGEISEDTAVEAMRAGAHDYLMKGRLTRLGEAVRRSLADAEVRRRAAAAEREKEAAHVRLEHINRVLKAIRNINQLIVTEKDPRKLAEEACRMLVETRGYNGAWIMVGAQGAPPHTGATAGFGPEFERFYSVGEGGRWPLCSGKALAAEQALALLDPALECQGCPLAEEYGSRAAAVACLTHGKHNLGMLGVSLPENLPVDEEEASLLTEVAGDLAFALHDMETERLGRERERQFQALFESMSQGAVYQDAEGHIIQANSAAERILGLTLDQMQGRTSLDPRWAAVRADGSPLPGEEHPAWVALQTGEPQDMLMGIFNPRDDRHRWIKAHSIPEFRNGEDLPFRVFSTFEDITDVREAQARLEASEQLLEATGRMARVGGWEVDPLTRKVAWTRITREIHEVTEDFEPSLEEALSFFHPDDRPRLSAAVAAALQEGKSYDMELRFTTAGGRELWAHTRGRPMMADGKVVRLVGTFQDITIRKEALKELASSERRFRRLFQNSLAPMVIADSQGRYLDVNPAACDLFGYDREQFLQMSVADLRSSTPTPAGEQFHEYKASPSQSGEFSFIRPDGEERIVAWSAAEIDDGAFASVLRDITALIKHEKEIRAEKDRAQQFLDVAATILLGLDRDGRITLLNRKGREVLGLEEEEILGQDWFQFVPEGDREQVRRIFSRIISGEVEAFSRVEAQVQTATGQRRLMVWHNAVVRQEDGTIRGTLSSGEDLTEQREMESQLSQADRLSSMGMLAAGVAHEINNPLTYVLYNLDSLTTDLSPLLEGLQECKAHLEVGPGSGTPRVLAEEVLSAIDSALLPDIGQRFDEALRGAHRIRDIVKSLSTFARVEREEAVPVDLRKVIDVALDMGSNEIKYRARLVKDYQDIPPVMGSEGRLAQVFLNLVINAAHAIEEGDVENNEIRLRVWEEDGKVVAEVRDTGCGIPRENLGRLFEPFFTTKDIGVGSGLGLAISHGIIEGYGGTISVESEVGEGTRFLIRLPTVDGEPQCADARSSGKDQPVVSGRLLIVDDEDAVRASLARTLRDHAVVEARNGAEAKEILERDAAFDLILCDMMMSDVSGMELHQWLTEHHPRLAETFIFMTGGAFTPRSREYLAKAENLRLEKPFDVAKLRSLVKELVRKAKGEKS